LIAGKSFPWQDIAGYYLRVRSFTPFTAVSGDKVGSPLLGAYGLVLVELPNPDVDSQQRAVTLPIEHRSDYKSVYRAHLDSGIKAGTNEVIILYEHRRGFLGRRKPCFHVAAYPTGTWQRFFDAVSNYGPREFQWPEPLFLFQPSSKAAFPAASNIFSP
jgi:hypothetical protein